MKNSLRVKFVLIFMFAFMSFANTKVFASSTLEEIEQDFCDLSTDEIVEIIIDEEIYYIGYYNKLNNAPMSISITS